MEDLTDAQVIFEFHDHILAQRDLKNRRGGLRARPGKRGPNAVGHRPGGKQHEPEHGTAWGGVGRGGEHLRELGMQKGATVHTL